LPKEKTVAARISKDLDEVLDEVSVFEGVDRSTALRKLVEKGARMWRRERAFELLEKGEVTLWKAAEIAGVSLWEMIDIVKDKKINWVKLTPEEIEREFEDAKKYAKSVAKR